VRIAGSRGDGPRPRLLVSDLPACRGGLWGYQREYVPGREDYVLRAGPLPQMCAQILDPSDVVPLQQTSVSTREGCSVACLTGTFRTCFGLSGNNLPRRLPRPLVSGAEAPPSARSPRDVHRAELGPAHRAEFGALEYSAGSAPSCQLAARSGSSDNRNCSFQSNA